MIVSGGEKHRHKGHAVDGCHTLHSIHHWYATVFEKFGWMVLAHRHRRSVKIASYFEGLERLIVTIDQKVLTTRSEDKVDDLRIMAANLQVLHKAAQRAFPSR